MADHAGVPEELDGRGIGSALVRTRIEDASSAEFRITPLYPFDKALYQDNPEWADVVL